LGTTAEMGDGDEDGCQGEDGHPCADQVTAAENETSDSADTKNSRKFPSRVSGSNERTQTGPDTSSADQHAS